MIIDDHVSLIRNHSDPTGFEFVCGEGHVGDLLGQKVFAVAAVWAPAVVRREKWCKAVGRRFRI